MDNVKKKKNNRLYLEFHKSCSHSKYFYWQDLIIFYVIFGLHHSMAIDLIKEKTMEKTESNLRVRPRFRKQVSDTPEIVKEKIKVEAKGKGVLEQIYFAEADCVAGVLEGCRYFGIH